MAYTYRALTGTKQMKLAILYNTSDYLLRFRTELISALETKGVEIVAITPHDETTPQLAKLGVKWREWHLDGQSISPVSDLKSIRNLHQILKDERPDAVLNFTIKPVLYGSLVARWLKVPRVVSMITGMGSVFLPGGIKKRALLTIVKTMYRAAMRKNDAVLFQNDEDMRYFLFNNFVDTEVCHRINGSGVNLEKFNGDMTKVQRGSFLLISRMIKEKGIFEFVEAARQVKRIYPNACFTLLGPIDNNPGAITRQEIAAWEAEGTIEYVGHQTDVRPFLDKAEVYVLPTYYLEGVPRTLLEALAMGKPIITSDWRGCRETVIPDVNGFLVPPADARALTRMMLRFLEKRDLSSRMGAASRQLAVNKFDVHQVNAKVISAIEG